MAEPPPGPAAAAGLAPTGIRRVGVLVDAAGSPQWWWSPRRPPHLTAAHGRPARFCRVGEALMDLLIGSDGRGGGAPPRARLSTLCRCAAARCGLVRAWCGARRWPNTPRRRSAALEQLGLRRKRRQYRPTTYEGRWHRGFGARRAPGAQKRPKTPKTAPPANSGGLRPADRPLKLIRSAINTCSGEIRAQCRNRAKSTGRAGRPHRVRTAPPLRRCSAPTLTVGSARFQRGIAELQRPQLRH
jgi:hypothetical protein